MIQMYKIVRMYYPELGERDNIIFNTWFEDRFRAHEVLNEYQSATGDFRKCVVIPVGLAVSYKGFFGEKVRRRRNKTFAELTTTDVE